MDQLLDFGDQVLDSDVRRTRRNDLYIFVVHMFILKCFLFCYLRIEELMRLNDGQRLLHLRH